MDEEIFQNLKEFLIEEGRGFIPLERATKLEIDLGIYGDDAAELIFEYGKRFEVDVSQFMLDKYFTGEGMNLGRFLSTFFKINYKGQDLTIGDLERGVIAGILSEQAINCDKLIRSSDTSKIYKGITLTLRGKSI